MERERWNSIADVDYGYNTTSNFSKFYNVNTISEKEGDQTPSPSSLPCNRFIEHQVSRYDTLAGIAIKYGVEVTDIKKNNSLVNDLQMFARKTLQIPLPGRHPPSPTLSNGCGSPGQSSADPTPTKHLPPDLLDSFQSLRPNKTHPRVSPAMTSLQGFYGLKPAGRNTTSEGVEMAVYKKGAYMEDDPSFFKPLSASNPPVKLHRNCRSEANGFFDENGEVRVDIMFAGEAKEGEPDKFNEKPLRRRPKSEAEVTVSTPEKLLEDNTSTGGFSTISSKWLALRYKAASRTNLLADSEVGFGPNSVGVGDGYVVNKLYAVRRSCSMSNLQDRDSSASSSSLRPASKLSLRSDLQVLSNAAITTSIGLPKPMIGRKNKAALD